MLRMNVAPQEAEAFDEACVDLAAVGVLDVNLKVAQVVECDPELTD